MSFLMSYAAYAVYFALFCLAVAFCAIWLVSRFEMAERALHSIPSQKPTTFSDQTRKDPVVEDAPYPIWQTNEQGQVSYANKAYLGFARNIPSAPADGPIPNLFRNQEPDKTGEGPYRASILDPENQTTHWFEVTSVSARGKQTHYASDANAVVKAEVAQRNFVQTLTKTFAQLSIGLAIFDRNRQLALFNPALIDLTTLPADFLSARPNLQAFFDRMRETRSIPEPKNYASWRKQIADVVVAASDDRYSETWSLPSGLTYRVTGRPHPDGAVAFLFEDISAEISLTRHFRAELELGHSILDTLEDAICVFSTTGILTSSNLAYRHLWGVNPDLAFAEMSVRDATRHWQSKYPAQQVWNRVQDFVGDFGVRLAWQEKVKSADGQVLSVSVSPIAGGATMLTFTPIPAVPAKPAERIAQKLTV